LSTEVTYRDSVALFLDNAQIKVVRNLKLQKSRPLTTEKREKNRRKLNLFIKLLIDTTGWDIAPSLFWVHS
jgi:hypothetical protein